MKEERVGRLAEGEAESSSRPDRGKSGCLKQLLIKGAEELGIPLSDMQAGTCLRYLSELKKWNRKISLTAIRDDREVIIKHFLDSFSYLKGFVPQGGMKLLDMGSGAGFPALPIKIVHPEISVTMVESVQKKASFLRHIARTLEIEEVEIVARRTGDLPDEYRSRFEIVTARAFADMEKALEDGGSFLKPGGVMVLSRGPEETIEDAASKKLGFEVERTVPLVLPYSDFRRILWVFLKKA